MASKKSSKKNAFGNCTIPYRILRSMDFRSMTSSLLSKELGITKQVLNYWLRKLRDEGLIERPYRGIYDITDIGKKILDGFTIENGKSLVRLENMRFSFPIKKNLQYLQSNFRWKKTSKLNGVTILYDKIWGHSIRIICNPTNPIVEITCKQKLGDNIYEMYDEAKDDVKTIAEIFAEQTKVVLGEPKPAMKPEWAVPSEMAEALLSATCSSQIRTPKGIINRSKGRNADLEVRDPRHAVAILEMPLRIERLEKMVISSLYSGISFL